MDRALAVQYLLVGLAVFASLVFVLRRQFPLAFRRGRIAVAVVLLRPRRPRWLQRLGRLIAPPASGKSSPVCGGCDGCGPVQR